MLLQDGYVHDPKSEVDWVEEGVVRHPRRVHLCRVTSLNKNRLPPVGPP